MSQDNPQAEDRVRDSLKCPICWDVASGIKIFICPKGHNMCEKCKMLNDSTACHTCKIPVHEYGGLTRNTALEALVESLGYPYACLSNACSEKKPTKKEMANHMVDCSQRMLCCPIGGDCCPKLEAGSISQHVKTDHADKQRNSILPNGTVRVGQAVGQDLSLSHLSSIIVSDNQELFILAVAETSSVTDTGCDFVHVWLTCIDPNKKASCYSAAASISLGNQLNSASPCPVYPVDIGTGPLNLFETCVLHLGNFFEELEEDFSKNGKLELVIDLIVKSNNGGSNITSLKQAEITINTKVGKK